MHVSTIISTGSTCNIGIYFLVAPVPLQQILRECVSSRSYIYSAHGVYNTHTYHINLLFHFYRAIIVNYEHFTFRIKKKLGRIRMKRIRSTLDKMNKKRRKKKWKKEIHFQSDFAWAKTNKIARSNEETY